MALHSQVRRATSSHGPPWRSCPPPLRALTGAGLALATLDGDGADELIWYGPGTAADFRWDGLPQSKVQTVVRYDGDALPLAGDFDGDGLDDIAWYGPGGAAEAMWWGQPTGVTAGPLAIG